MDLNDEEMLAPAVQQAVAGQEEDEPDVDFRSNAQRNLKKLVLASYDPDTNPPSVSFVESQDFCAVRVRGRAAAAAGVEQKTR